ncbi:ATP-dependent DNA helicase RecG [Burkholderiaceae bacterium DAT-1]|nr:ATP-dependent DNA helicase RecG [Burkholderiaceae bacterium DAT-1]
MPGWDSACHRGEPGMNFERIPKSRRDQLAKLHIHSGFDLVLHLPLRYEDETRLYPIAEAPMGIPVQVEGTVTSSEVTFRPRKQLVARIQEANDELIVRLLNFYPSQQQQLATGKRVRLLGEIRRGFLGDEMVHPKIRVVTDTSSLSETLTPVYGVVNGLNQATIRRLVMNALEQCPLTDTLPQGILDHHNLMGFADAVKCLHAPPPDVRLSALSDRTHPAWERMKFDELLAQQLSMRLAYQRRREHQAPVIQATGKLAEPLLARLPFKLTGAQSKVLKQIRSDLASSHPMQRLLQGDVGSGKTIVSALAALDAIEAGYQVALMAPTEILAEQHWKKFSEWLSPLGLEIVWLAGSLKAKDKAHAVERVAGGHAAIAVGTHALFQETVQFERLGLVIVDEQHRFGVHQRLALRSKGASPHLLMMSATPIPRTLAMSYYADLDVSVIDELPPGRTPIRTHLINDARRDEMVARVKHVVESGRQAYWVCPLIEESETLQLQTAVDTWEQLSGMLAPIPVGLVHGRLKPAEKAAVMAAFASGELSVLVATTVIEVGVDVPNATLMVIEHAERMGLAQLHQLRGRVGRGGGESHCVLLFTTPLGEVAKARLKVIYESTDGFVIAREDLRIRGPGEFLGARQSGVPMLRFADLEQDVDLLDAARDLAEELIRNAPGVADQHLNRWLAGREALLRS